MVAQHFQDVKKMLFPELTDTVVKKNFYQNEIIFGGGHNLGFVFRWLKTLLIIINPQDLLLNLFQN